jgi:hypothetical protein
MNKLMIASLVLSLAGSATTFAQAPPPAAAAAGDATGTWNANFVTQNGEIPAQIKIAKSGDKLTGTISSQMGESKLEAEQKGKAVSIWFTMQGQNGPMAIELSATQDGDSMKGTAMASGTPAGEWTATRDKTASPTASTTSAASSTTSAPAATASLTGTWSVALQLDSISATPTMVLKQEGEKLTGEYVSQQYGKFPLTGTVKGPDVTINFAMNVEGTALNVTYAGKIDKDGKIAGTANLGDMMSGTFTATRQK